MSATRDSSSMYGRISCRAERAVEADRERPRVAHRVPERLGGLAGERAPGGVGDGAGDHHRQPRAALARSTASIANSAALAFSVSKIVSTRSRSTPPSTSASHRLGVGRDQLVEGDVAEARVVDVGRDRRGAVGRPERAGDEARLVRRASRSIRRRTRARAAPPRGSARAPGPPCRSRPGDRRGVEGVGLDDVGAGLEIRAWISRMISRLRQRQQVVVALQVVRVIARSASPR